MRKFFKNNTKLPVQARASFWFLICSFLQKGISIIETPIFTRLLNTEEYGNYSVFNFWLSILSIFVALQLYSGVYEQGLIKFDKERNVFASSLQGLTLILCCIWTIVYLVAHNFWNDMLSLSTVQVFAMLLLIWTTSIFRFWSAEQRVEYKYKSLVLITFLVSVMKPVIGIIFVILAQDKVIARILGLALVELVGYIGLFVVQMQRGKVFLSVKFWKYALLFNIPLVPHYLAQVVLAGSDRIMIQNMVSSSSAGVYSLAYSISSIMTLFNAALTQTITPWMYQKIKENKIKNITGIVYLSLIFIAVLNIMLMLFAPEIIMFFAPKSYYDAILVIPPVAMSAFFVFMYELFAKYEFFYEKTKFIMFASITGAALNIILNYIFISVFGYYAAGYTTLACYIVYALGHYISMNRVTKIYLNIRRAYNTKILLLISGLFMAVGFIVLLSYNYVVLRYSIGIVIFVIIFILKKKIFVFAMDLLKTTNVEI